MKKLYEKKYLLIVFSCVLLVFLALYKITGFYYAINDDISMSKIVSGAISGTPDGHSVFIRYILGAFLAWCFKSNNGIDWYGIVMVGSSFVCYGILMSRVCFLTENFSQKYWIRTVTAVIFVLIFIRSVVFFQFTIVAGTIGATATFLVITRKRDETIFYDLLVCILYVLTYVVRSKVFWMFMPICGLSILYGIFQTNDTIDIKTYKISDWIKPNLQWLLIIVVGLILLGNVRVIEKSAYSAEEWYEYNKFKSYRAQIVDYAGFPNYEENVDFYNELGISYSEYKCLPSMFGVLPDIDLDVMREIAEWSQSTYNDQTIKIKLDTMYSLLKNAIISENCRELNIIFAISIICLLFSLHKYDKRERCIISLGIAVQLMILLYLLWKGRMPDRIVQIYEMECILCIIAVQLRNLTIISEKYNLRKIVNLFGVIFSMCLMLWVTSRLEAQIENYKMKMNLYEEFTDYISNYPENVYITRTGTISAVKQFKFYSESKMSNTMGTSGWSSKSPFLKKKMERLGINEKVPLLLGDNVYYMTTVLESADNINEYYQSIYENCGDYEIVDEIVLSDGKLIYVCKW